MPTVGVERKKRKQICDGIMEERDGEDDKTKQAGVILCLRHTRTRKKLIFPVMPNDVP